MSLRILARAIAPLTAVAGLLILTATAQESRYPGHPDYAVSGLDAALTENVNAVVRVHEVVFEATTANRARTRVRRVVTVLNAEGREAGSLSVWYDSFRRIRSLEASIVGGDGRRIRRVRNAEMQDLSLISGFSLYEDSRERVVDIRHDAYPYTVVFEYELEHRGLLSWPTWFPLDSEASVEWARLKISAPPDVAVRYHIRGNLNEPVVAEGLRTELEWTISNIPYSRPEPMGPPLWAQYPSVMVAPDRFEIGGHAGRMDSWAAFGQWYHDLSKGRDVLTPSTREMVRAIRSEAASDRDVVRMLYEHVQRNTRYVNVALGIGGWQPFDARYVIERGYGDCKALTNYLHALLKEAGVEAYPALIRSERYPRRTIPEFPNNQFNHVILMVPLTESADTLWLEATSQTISFGHIGSSNENRWALVVKDGASELVRTPVSLAARNRQERSGHIAIDSDGRATASLVTRYTGDQQNRMQQLATASATARDRWIHSSMGIGDYRVVSADFEALGARAEESSLPVELVIPRFASRMGSRMIFEPHVIDRWRTIPAPNAERRQDVVIAAYPYLDHDRLEYVLPEGYRVEALASPVILESDFGRFEMTLDVSDDGSLVFERMLEIRDAILPASSFDSYREFAEAIVRADAARVVLVAD